MESIELNHAVNDLLLGNQLAPTEQEVALLTAQYHKALDGLYEAYKFGQMLLRVKERLESDPHGSPENQGLPGGAARDTARCEQAHGGALYSPGWNAGMGLKGWLAEHCPEINYSTARRFLSIAEKTNAALAAAPAEVKAEPWGEAPCASAGVEGAAQVGQGRALSTAPSEQAVRDFLEGKSQRAVLRLGGKREGAGRKPKDWAAAMGTSPEVAMKRLEAALAPLNELIVVKHTHRLLAEVDLESVRAAIDLLHEVIHAE